MTTMVGAKLRSVPLLRMLCVAVIGLMAAVIVYMYRTIENMHKDQQELRVQLAELATLGRSSGLATGAELPPNLLVQPPEFLLAQQSMRNVLDEGLGMAGLQAPAGEQPLPPSRHLSAMTVGTSAGVGCFTIADTATVSHDVSTASCNSNFCPDCFVTPSTVSADISLTIQKCSTAKWVRSASRTGIWTYTFINTDSTYTLSVTDNSASPITYRVPPRSFVTAFCASSQGTTNRLMFPSSRVPTLTVDSGFTLSAGNFDASASTGTFQTSSGANTLNGNTVISGTRTFSTGTGSVSLRGATTVADSTSFTVGSATLGGTSTFFGNVVIGGSGSGAGVSTTMYGSFTQTDPTGGSAATFSTGTGAISLNGNVAVASGKNLHMSSTGGGTFQTSSGTVTFNGNTVISGSNTFSTGTGDVSLRGATKIADSTTFTVGSSGVGGTSTFYGAVNIGASGAAVTTTMIGNFVQSDPSSGTATFSTGSGGVSLNGDITVASTKNFDMSGSTGWFKTGTGQVTLNGNTAISGSNTFSTGIGAVSLNGATAVADSKPFTVGSPGAGGATQFFGTVTVGGSSAGNSRDFTVYGNVAFNDDGANQKTFSTATGAVQLNGHVAVAKDKDLSMYATGTGAFVTGTGSVSFNGDTRVAVNRKFFIDDYQSLGYLKCDNTDVDTTANYCRANR